MKGELLLIRHGKAGTAEPDKNDFYRPLTDKGRTEFTTFLQKVKPKLNQDALEIWTSPLIRAKETAEIVASELTVFTYEEKQFLANGDLGACLKALEMKPDFRVACVGHEPFMSMWVYELTGISTPFHKGAVLRIVFDGEKVTLDLKLSPKKIDLF